LKTWIVKYGIRAAALLGGLATLVLVASRAAGLIDEPALNAIFYSIMVFTAAVVAASTALGVKRAQVDRGEAEDKVYLVPGNHDIALKEASAAPMSKRESLAVELLTGARIDDLKATLALSLIPVIVIGGAALTGYSDGAAPDNNAALAYALVKRLGFLGVTFYLAHAAVSQYRYSTLRAAHYRACAQAIRVCDNDASLVAVYKMLLPPHAFGAAPTSPVDALVKIAPGKD
jgi:hypothetical protein